MLHKKHLRQIALASLVFSIFVFIAGCGSFRQAPSVQEDGPVSFAATSVINEGRRLHFIADVRSPRLRGPDNWVGIQVAILNVAQDDLTMSRESFILESEDSSQAFPVASFDEFKDEYTKQRVDARVGRDFRESVNGRYPQPPYTQRPLEFFPSRTSSVAPRSEITLRPGQIVLGWLYFSFPESNVFDEIGNANLLLKPLGEEETYILELKLFEK